MLINLLVKVKKALVGYPVDTSAGQTDNLTVVKCICGNGHEILKNHANKICERRKDIA